MVLSFGMSMLGGGSIAPVTCCSTVSITNSRCDLCTGAGSRVVEFQNGQNFSCLGGSH